MAKKKDGKKKRERPITVRQAQAVYSVLSGMDYIGGCCDDPDWKELVKQANEDLEGES